MKFVSGSNHTLFTWELGEEVNMPKLAENVAELKADDYKLTVDIMARTITADLFSKVVIGSEVHTSMSSSIMLMEKIVEMAIALDLGDITDGD